MLHFCPMIVHQDITSAAHAATLPLSSFVRWHTASCCLDVPSLWQEREKERSLRCGRLRPRLNLPPLQDFDLAKPSLLYCTSIASSCILCRQRGHKIGAFSTGAVCDRTTLTPLKATSAAPPFSSSSSFFSSFPRILWGRTGYKRRIQHV